MKRRKESREGSGGKLIDEYIDRGDYFGASEPKKHIPGVMGRSAWFAERAGCKPDSLSIERLRAAIQVAGEMREAGAETSRLDQQAIELLHKAGLHRKQPSRPVLIDSAGRKQKVETTRSKKDAGLSGISSAVKVKELKTPWAALMIPVDREKTKHLDLEDVFGADLSNRRNPRILDSFQYLAEYGMIVGRIDKEGVYQAFAGPKHPWIRLALKTLCLHWKWITIDPVILKLRAAQTGPTASVVDRICQLILCAPDYMELRDPEIFGRAGIGFPPGFRGGKGWPGDPGLPPGIGGGKTICDQCLGDFLGELEIIDDVIIPPPIVKWCWVKPRCSRWKSIGPFPNEDFVGIGRVTQIDVHPRDGNKLIAGAAGGGVWRTDNGGVSWRPLMELQPTLTMGAVAFAPSNPQVLYAASGEDGGGWNPAWGGVGIYRSSDGGVHWNLMTSVPSTLFSAIAVHPNDPNTVYAAGDSGLHKSRDGGATWITNPGRASLFDGRITDIVIAHDDPDRIYIGVRSNGVWRSTNGGEQVGATPAFTRLDGTNQVLSGSAAGWIKLSIGRNGADGSNFVVAKMGANGGRIFRTTDGGTIWTELAQNVATVSFDEWCSIIAVDPTDQDILYAGAAGALLRTTNGGVSSADWTSISAGTHPDQQDLSIDPNDATRIFLANDGGVYRSDDRGDNWVFASGRLAITQFYDIDISERDKDIVAGGAQDNGAYYRDASGNWISLNWLWDGTQVAIDPTDPQIFYFSSQNGSSIRKSIDGGGSHQPIGSSGWGGSSPWIQIIKLDPTDPIANPETNRTIFAGRTNVLYRSTDGGQNWQRVEDGAGNAFTTNGSISALEFAPGNPSILYLGTSSGALYRAVNGGSVAGDWTRIDTVGSSAEALFPNAQIQAVRINPNDEDDVWVVFGGTGVNFTSRPNLILNPLGISHIFRSTDAGGNWADASGQFTALSLPDVPTSAVAISDVDGDIAYAGTDVGVFRTTDGGDSWKEFQDGLPHSPIVELRFNRRYNRLYAATMGRGVYIRDV